MHLTESSALICCALNRCRLVVHELNDIRHPSCYTGYDKAPNKRCQITGDSVDVVGNDIRDYRCIHCEIFHHMSTEKVLAYS
jgi:hypothetical protein